MSELTPDTPQQDNPGQDAAIKADLLTGLFLLVIGLTVLYLSWDMPRLETRRIHPATIPGLVPGLLGGALALCGFLLAVHSARVAPVRSGWDRFARLFVTIDAIRILSLGALVLVYTLVLVGAVPFWLATAIFVFAFILMFETIMNDTPVPVFRSMFWALVQAVIVSGVVTFVFERGFLVRLPGG